jgi:mannose-6-phosphate isomerase-like protein (cupin superfamily)
MTTDRHGLQEGEVVFTLGEATIEATAGDIVVVPAGTPHKFVSRGRPTARSASTRSPGMETEWLE